MSGLRLTDAQRLDWLRLIRSENIGPRTFRGLINRFGSAGAALEALPGLARRGGRLLLKVTSRSEAEEEMARAAHIGARFVAAGEAGYPRALLATDTAPPLIAVRGSAAALTRPMVGIVGSRNASAAGRKFTEMLARGLGDVGFVTVSGLARGVDTAAHRASLGAGTVAVLAGGHERIYPSENAGLLEQILEAGAVVTEMPIGWEPRARDFPRRNRIVSGLSLGVVVVEAALRSGSLITARFALEQGREVFAVPGSPLDPRAAGTNDLLRQGANLCTSAADVVAALTPLLNGAAVPQARLEEGEAGVEPLWDELDLAALGLGAIPPSPLWAGELGGMPAPEDMPAEDDRSRLLQLLGSAPILVDDLVREVGLPSRTVQTILLELELAGWLERHGGGRVSAMPR